MWSKIILYLPGWEVLLQGLIIFIIPYILSKFFDLIYGSDKDELG